MHYVPVLLFGLKFEILLHMGPEKSLGWVYNVYYTVMQALKFYDFGVL